MRKASVLDPFLYGMVRKWTEERVRYRGHTGVATGERPARVVKVERHSRRGHFMSKSIEDGRV